MNALTRVAGALSAAGGIVGAAVLGGTTAQRLAIHRYRDIDGGRDDDPTALFDRLPTDRCYSVAADDGVPLHVEEVGPLDAPLTVIFSHGWTLRLGAWHFQRLAFSGNRSRHTPTAGSASHPVHLAPDGVDSVRLVLYDQRSHGRSGRGSARNATIDQLADDLAAVVATSAPTGPVVFVGHSMGGMAILALAGRRPQWFAARVAGVGLISTSASETGHDARRWLQVNGANPLLPALATAAARYPRVVDRARGLGHNAVWLATRAFGFADPAVPAPLVDYVDRMISATPIDVIAPFAPSLFSHDQRAALAALRGIPALVAVGAGDRITPPSRAEEMAAKLPEAELEVIPCAGHMLPMESADAVNEALMRLLRRAAGHRRGDTGAPDHGVGGDAGGDAGADAGTDDRADAGAACPAGGAPAITGGSP